VVVMALLFSGCVDFRVNTYGSGWIWPLAPWPGISWGHRNYYYGDYYSNNPRYPYHQYRWVPGHYE
jgi:hypothetical protein